MCIDCKYYKGKCTNPNGCAEKEELQQIRADVIEECIKTMQKMFEYTDNQGLPHYALYAWISLISIRDTLEQLKEQSNDNSNMDNCSMRSS